MTRTGCVCCPYPFLAIPGVLSFIAMTFTWLAAIDCNFYKISYQEQDSTYSSLHVGLWTVETRDYDWFYENYNSSTCTVWEDYTLKDNLLSSDDLDGAMKTARAFGVASGILSIPAFVMIMIPACVSFGNEMQYVRILAGILIFLGIFTILDLVALSSDICKDAVSCMLQTSGILAVVASGLWLMIAGLMFVVMKQPRALRNDSAVAPNPVVQCTELRDIRTIQNTDGSATTTTTTTVINADGTKFVTMDEVTSSANADGTIDDVTMDEVTSSDNVDGTKDVTMDEVTSSDNADGTKNVTMDEVTSSAIP